MIVDVVVAAGGKGRRFGGAVPKQWLSIGDRTIFERSVAACAASPRVRGIVVVVPDGDVEHARTLAAGAAGAKLLHVVAGGARRQDSVAAGVAALPGDADVVLVHDAARPFVTGAIIGRVIDAAAREGAAIAGARVHDTVKHVARDGSQCWIDGTIARDDLALAQTPQGFRRDVLEVLVPLMTSPTDVTDEAALAERAGYRVHVVDGHADNVKITTEDDLSRRAGCLAASPRPSAVGAIRIGLGYDSHRFADDRRLWSAVCTCPTRVGSRGTPMATPSAMRSPTPCSVPRGSGTSAACSRTPIRPGRMPTASRSSATHSAASRRRVGVSATSTSS